MLVVEDDESYLQALSTGLRREGFRVSAAGDGIEALELFEKISPDIVLLDLRLPLKSGTDVCREIRRRSAVPIIILSAKSNESDIIVGLEVGADDYLTKPYRMGELVARIRAVMRRSLAVNESTSDQTIVEVDGLSFDKDRHEVRLHGTLLAVPLKEFQLLELLLRNAGRPVSRKTLLDTVWRPDFAGDDKTLDVHIKRLRAKIEEDPSHPRRLVTVHGVGYKIQIIGTESTNPRVP